MNLNAQEKARELADMVGSLVVDENLPLEVMEMTADLLKADCEETRQAAVDIGSAYGPYRIQGGRYLVRRRKGKQSIIYIGCLPVRTNWKNRKRNVRFNKSIYAIL